MKTETKLKKLIEWGYSEEVLNNKSSGETQDAYDNYKDGHRS